MTAPRDDLANLATLLDNVATRSTPHDAQLLRMWSASLRGTSTTTDEVLAGPLLFAGECLTEGCELVDTRHRYTECRTPEVTADRLRRIVADLEALDGTAITAALARDPHLAGRLRAHLEDVTP